MEKEGDQKEAGSENTETEAKDPKTATGSDAGTDKGKEKPTDSGKSKTSLTDDEMEESEDWISKLEIEDNQKKYLKRTITQNRNRKEKIDELQKTLGEKEKKEADEQRKRDEEQGNWKKIAEDTEARLKSKDLKLMRAEVRARAIKEGIVDPDIIDMFPLDGISLDDDGNVVGAEKLVSKYKKEKAYLFGEAPGSKKTEKEPEGTTSDKSAPPPSGAAVTKDAMQMTDEEFVKARASFVSQAS